MIDFTIMMPVFRPVAVSLSVFDIITLLYVLVGIYITGWLFVYDDDSEKWNIMEKIIIAIFLVIIWPVSIPIVFKESYKLEMAEKKRKTAKKKRKAKKK